MIRFDGELAESYEINCAENYEKVSAKISLIECERKIFPSIHQFFSPAEGANGFARFPRFSSSRLHSRYYFDISFGFNFIVKTFNFLSPSPYSFSRLHSHLAFLLRSHLSERREKNAIGRKKSSCRKFMNKFKDAIYGLRKEIAIPNFLCSSNKRKVTEFMNSKWQFSPAIVHDDG